MTKPPKCPYCGAEMTNAHYMQAYWYDCTICKTNSPVKDSAEKAREAALHRTEPDETCKQLCESFGASANATVGELFDAIEQLNSSAEPKEDERSA